MVYSYDLVNNTGLLLYKRTMHLVAEFHPTSTTKFQQTAYAMLQLVILQLRRLSCPGHSV